jgi:hypothetical protein
LGEFEVDKAIPFYLTDSPSVDGLTRQVIVFRLRPIGRFVTGDLGPAAGSPATGVVSSWRCRPSPLA